MVGRSAEEQLEHARPHNAMLRLRDRPRPSFLVQYIAFRRRDARWAGILNVQRRINQLLNNKCTVVIECGSEKWRLCCFLAVYLQDSGMAFLSSSQCWLILFSDDDPALEPAGQPKKDRGRPISANTLTHQWNQGSLSSTGRDQVIYWVIVSIHALF